MRTKPVVDVKHVLLVPTIIRNLENYVPVALLVGPPSNQDLQEIHTVD